MSNASWIDKVSIEVYGMTRKDKANDTLLKLREKGLITQSEYESSRKRGK